MTLPPHGIVALGGAKVTLGDGAMIVEELVAWDDDAMSYTYTAVEGPLPVDNYESTITVTEAGEG